MPEEADDPPVPELPPRPTIPDPPKPTFRRPAKPEDPSRRNQRLSVGEVRGMGEGWAVATALISSIVAGTLLGMAADRWLVRKDTPWGLIVGFLLGCVSGFGNMFRLAAQINRREEQTRGRRP